MEWKRQVPNSPGNWLRLIGVGGGGQIQVHVVLQLHGELQMLWGTGSGKSITRIKDIKRKVGGFFWYGPIPVAPPNEERYVDPVHTNAQGI